ncbi:MAG: hypothetical protein M3464_15585 [Chloroflexota bacterium]|nr:hypothetical protein [Chloroflexota bacterium]
MTRSALIVLSVVAVLLTGIAHVNASGKQASDATIVELEARIEALEAVAIMPQDIPIYPRVYTDAVPITIDPTNLDDWDIVPLDPAFSLDLVCNSHPTYLAEDVTQPDLTTLRCVRYTRFMPYPPADINYND